MAFIKQDRDPIDLARDALTYTLTTKDDTSVLQSATPLLAGLMSAQDKIDLELLKDRDFFGDFGTVYTVTSATASTITTAVSNIVLPAGGYLMRASAGTAANNTSQDLYVQLQHNGLGIGNFQRMEYKDAAGSQVIHGTTIGTNQSVVFNTFGFIQLVTDQTVSIDVVAFETGNQAYIWDIFIEMVRFF